jgi:fatty-acid desaturase/AcrR family transcriptional regulator
VGDRPDHPYVFVVVPSSRWPPSVPAVWGWGLSWLDVGLAVGFYSLTLLGITVGYHRYFTHGSFKAARPLRIALAVVGCMAIQGPVVQWVADHRRHHAFSDREGDPHSPWRYGTDARALLKGMWHAHLGWLFDRRQTNAERYAPDLLKDTGLRRTSRLFILWAFLSLALPAVIGGLVTASWTGAWTAFFWAGLVRVALLHHVTWSINSVCHVVGDRPFASRDRATNFWPLAILSAGSPGTTCTTPTRPAPARGAARADRHQRPGDLAVREARLGARGQVARPGEAGGQAPHPGDGRVLSGSAGPPPRGRTTRRSPARNTFGAVPGGAARPRVRMTGAQRRQQLLDVGREVFARRGYDGTSIEELAARADVSKPVVYEHFGGKEGLYTVVVDRGDAAAAGPLHLRAGRRWVPARAARARRAGAAGLHRGGHRRLPGAHPRLAHGRLARWLPVPDRRGRPPGGARPRRAVQRPRPRPGAGRTLQPGTGGLVALVGQWWLERRSPPKHEVAAHLVELAYNGLAHLQRRPTRGGPRAPRARTSRRPRPSVGTPSPPALAGSRRALTGRPGRGGWGKGSSLSRPAGAGTGPCTARTVR